MDEDIELRSTLENTLIYVVSRMESSSDPKNRESIFQEYKEWLGSSIDDWVLALPNDWGKTDLNFY